MPAAVDRRHAAGAAALPTPAGTASGRCVSSARRERPCGQPARAVEDPQTRRMDVAEHLARAGGIAGRRELVAATGRTALAAAVANGAVLRVARGRYALPTASVAQQSARELTGTAGFQAEDSQQVLVFDEGMGGYLPLSHADISCDPLSFASARIIPVPSTLKLITGNICIVKQTRRALYHHWMLSEGEEESVRTLLARTARLVTEITLAVGGQGHLAALDEIFVKLATQGLKAAWTLGSSLHYFREQWEKHANNESCPEGTLPGAECRTLSSDLPGKHRYTFLHGLSW